MSFFGLDRISKFMKIVKENGGIRGSLYTYYRTSDLKTGTLVGTDAMGNKYYENNRYFVGTNRWIIYAPKVGTDFDASQIDARWFGWLHYKTDQIPDEVTVGKYDWVDPHTENLTGTKDAYVPFSTTKPKVEAWIPNKN